RAAHAEIAGGGRHAARHAAGAHAVAEGEPGAGAALARSVPRGRWRCSRQPAARLPYTRSKTMSTPSQKPRPSRPDTEPGKRKQPAVSPWPFFWCGLSVLLYVFHPHLHTLLPGVELEHLHNVAAVSLFYSFGWLMAHSFRAFVTRKGREKGRRRAPRLLSELVSVTLFTVATMLAIGVLIGKSSGGV